MIQPNPHLLEHYRARCRLDIPRAHPDFKRHEIDFVPLNLPLSIGCQFRSLPG
jgi:hypothetical protein